MLNLSHSDEKFVCNMQRGHNPQLQGVCRNEPLTSLGAAKCTGAAATGWAQEAALKFTGSHKQNTNGTG